VIAAGKGTKYLPAYHTVTPDGVWEYYGITPPECHFRTPCFFDLLPAEL
jgi:hypothetical protein